MSSPPKGNPEEPEMKGGHLPAVKAGNMRIVQRKPPKDDNKECATATGEEGDVLKVSTSPPKQAVCFVSGAPNRGHADFPKEHVQAFHDKIPSSAPHVNKPTIIQQPSKK